MTNQTQAWLAAVGSKDEQLPNEWIWEMPDLLREWPLVGGRDHPGIRAGDHLLYYAPGPHYKLIAAVRAVGSPSSADRSLPVQAYVAVPILRFAPDWGVVGVHPRRLASGKRAILLEDAEYEKGLASLTAVAEERFKD